MNEMGEKNENSKIGYMVNGEFKEISPITLETNPPTFDYERRTDFDGGSMTIELIYGSTEALKQMGILIDLKHLREYTNNWRKIHHLTKRRKKVR